MTDGGQITVGGVLYDVQLTAHTAPPTPPPAPVPGVRQRIMWHQGWTGPSIDSWPVDVAAGITAVVLGMSQAVQSGRGQLTTPAGITRTQVAGLVGRGIDVAAGIGGGGDGGIAITTAAQVAEALASIRGMRTSLGITGVVMDLEGAPGQGWTEAAMVDLGHAVAADGLKFGICTSTWGGRLAAWGRVARALGDQLWHWERMFYDFAEAGDARLSGIVTSDLAAMRGHLTRDDQLVCALAPRPGDTPYPNSSPPAVLAAAYAAGRARYPGAGWAVYDDRADATIQWRGTRALAAL